MFYLFFLLCRTIWRCYAYADATRKANALRWDNPTVFESNVYEYCFPRLEWVPWECKANYFYVGTIRKRDRSLWLPLNATWVLSCDQIGDMLPFTFLSLVGSPPCKSTNTSTDPYTENYD